MEKLSLQITLILVVVLIPARLFSETVELEIDPSESFINTKPSSFNGLAFVEGKPQNSEGFGAPLSETLVLDITSSGIKIMPEATILVDHNETGFPGPFSGGDDTREFNQEPGPAVFAYEFSTPFPLSVAIRDLKFQTSDAAEKTLTNGNFPASGSEFSISSGVADITLGLPPQSDLTPYPKTINAAKGNGTWVDTDSAQKLTLTLNFSFEFPGAITIKSEYEGTIVAKPAAAPFALERPMDVRGRLDDDSRFYDYFSDAYTEVQFTPDGFYQIGNSDRQYGSWEVFKDQPFFQVGNVTVDDSNLTGQGVEKATVTGYSASFFESADSSRGPYDTTISNVAGSLGFVDGKPANLNMESDIELTFTTGAVNGFSFKGKMTVENNRFHLDVDKTNPTPLGSLRFRWGVRGLADLPGLPETSNQGAFLLSFSGILTPANDVGRKSCVMPVDEA